MGFDRPLKDYTGRFDWNPLSSDQITGRWQYTRQVFDNEDIIFGETTKQNNKQQNIGLTWTHLFGARTVGEARYGLGLRTTLVGIKAGNDTPIIRFTGTPLRVRSSATPDSFLSIAGRRTIKLFTTCRLYLAVITS